MAQLPDIKFEFEHAADFQKSLEKAQARIAELTSSGVLNLDQSREEVQRILGKLNSSCFGTIYYMGQSCRYYVSLALCTPSRMPITAGTSGFRTVPYWDAAIPEEDDSVFCPRPILVEVE